MLGHLSDLSPGCLWLGADPDFPLSVACKVLLFTPPGPRHALSFCSVHNPAQSMVCSQGASNRYLLIYILSHWKKACEKAPLYIS